MFSKLLYNHLNIEKRFYTHQLHLECTRSNHYVKCFSLDSKSVIIFNRFMNILAIKQIDFIGRRRGYITHEKSIEESKSYRNHPIIIITDHGIRVIYLHLRFLWTITGDV